MARIHPDDPVANANANASSSAKHPADTNQESTESPTKRLKLNVDSGNSNADLARRETPMSYYAT